MLVLVIAGLSMLVTFSVPASAPQSGRADRFSAERARSHVADLAQEPRPTGSPAAAHARNYLTATLTRLGLTPSVTASARCRSAQTEPSCGRVRNVTATIPGRSPRGTVLLVAHYDSVASGPGASDNGVGVAALLEIARVLGAENRPDNNVVLLFTDGEEAGLLGADAAVSGGNLPDPASTAVLNLDARGQSGPVVMFETGDRSGVVQALRGNSAIATSLARTVYDLLPNDTDFTVFRGAGYTGLNFAPVFGTARYDTAADDLPHLNSATLQDVGDTVLTATERLASADLTRATAPGKTVFFPVFDRVVTVSQAWSTAIGAVALALFGWAMGYAWRRGVLRARRIFGAGALSLTALVVTVLTGLIGWQAVRLARPDFAGFVLGDPYRPLPAYVGFGIIAVGVGLICRPAAARRIDAVHVVAGWSVVNALVGVAALAFAPGAAYLFVLPVIAAAAVLVALARRPTPRATWWPLMAAVPAGVTLATWLPVTLLLFPVMGLAGVAVAMVPVTWQTLAVAALVPARASGAGPNRYALLRRLAAATTVAVGAATVAVGVTTDPVNAANPRQVSLMYAWDAQTRTASWLSPYPEPDPFVDHYVHGPARRLDGTFPLLPATGLRTGPARAVPVANPVADHVKVTRSNGERRIRLRIAADRADASVLGLYVDATAVVTAKVAGVRMAGGANRPGAKRWPWGFQFVGAGADGVDVDLTVRGDAPLRIRVLAQTAGVPEQAMDRPMPADRAGAIGTAVRTVSAVTVTR